MIFRGHAKSVALARRVAARLFNVPDRPTAVVAANDLLAAACYHEADVRGLTVGADLSIDGFDDSLTATIRRPGLSSVSQPLEQVGQEIIRLVAQLLSGSPPHDQQVLLAPTLVVRESSSQRVSLD
jgi:DNA-binding LacI/PurR family transcriptional regulator